MAAGAGSSSGHGGRGSSAALESSLDRRFQGVSNTMESIQGLSTWCIENKKYHVLIVRYWMKWLRKSEPSHRLNLFYLANDVIQNCKRKNAIVYRSTFADVLPEAALLVKDVKVRKSIERIFTIWEERNVYPEELISELKSSLAKKEQPAPPAPANPKAALKSKIVAEFAPQVFIEQLSVYKQSVEEAELKEKQLSALRVDVCSTEALKRLKDKAGGKKFSKDFEEGSGKLQEFVNFLEQQVKGGPPLLEALGNADVFYEMQYKEVKIVANAYKTFANRVSNLKRKLDALKATLPDPDDSPIPSPSEDAPSPTGSESPFHGMVVGGPKGEVSGSVTDGDGRAVDSRREAPFTLGDTAGPRLSPSVPHSQAHGHGEGDNRDVEDMELSEGEEAESTSIIVEEQREKPGPITVAKPAPAATAAAAAPPLRTSEEPPLKKPAMSTPVTPSTPAAPLSVNLANVDLGKISSILNSLTSVMKNTGVSPVSRPSPGTPTTPSAQGAAVKPATPTSGGAPAPNPLASILSRVDITPEGILSALSKTQGQTGGIQGLSSLLHSVTGNSSATANAAKERVPNPAATGPPRGHTYASPEPSSSSCSSAMPVLKSSTAPSTPKPKALPGNNYKREVERELERESSSSVSSSSSPSSLESKIHKFLQGNPGFSTINLGIPILSSGPAGSGESPLLGSENVDGTPVRDETGGTPTQDEIMDKPALLTEASSLGGVKKLASAGHDLSPTAYRSDSWDVGISPDAVFGQADNDGDYRTSHYPGYGTEKKASKSILKLKGEDAVKKRTVASMSGVPSATQDTKPGHVKARKESYGGPGGSNSLGKPTFYDGVAERRGSVSKDPHHQHPAPSTERVKNVVTRKMGSSMEEGGTKQEEEGEGGKENTSGGTPPASEAEGSHYHRIETVVSSTCGEGAPIETLGYSNRRMSGERIQTVESIRVIGRGSRPHGRGGGAGARPGTGGGSWYDEAYMEGPPPPIMAPPPSIGLPPHPSNSTLSTQGGSDDRSLGSSALPPPPHLLPPHLAPGQFQFEERPIMPFPGDDPHSRPHPHQHPPPSSFFSSPPPPIPQPPPPPIPQPPPPPRDFLSPPSAVMVGGVLVPVDRALPFPPARPDGGDRGGGNSSGTAGSTAIGGTGNPSNPLCPPPLMSSLLGDPPQFKDLPHTANVKDHFSPCHAPPLHRPGTPGPPPPLLGRARDAPNSPPSSTASSGPPSPSGDPPSLLPPNRNSVPPPSQSPTSPNLQSHNHRRPSPPLSLMRLPSPNPRLPLRPPHPQPTPPPQRQFLRGRLPHPLRHPHFERDPPFRAGKQPGPPFAGAPGNGVRGSLFYPPKRPFLPPRY